jgi:hypothetical protein
VTYQTIGHRKFLIVPNMPNYRVEFQGNGTGSVTINLADYRGQTRQRFEQYLRVDVNPRSRGTFSLGGVGKTVRYDLNGTGVFTNHVPSMVSTS